MEHSPTPQLFKRNTVELGYLQVHIFGNDSKIAVVVAVEAALNQLIVFMSVSLCVAFKFIVGSSTPSCIIFSDVFFGFF